MLKNNKGLTYLELLITAAIVAYIVLAYAQLFLRNVVVTTQSELRTLAYNYAADYMEEIVGDEFVDISDEDGEAYRDSQQKQLGRNKVWFTRQAVIDEKLGGCDDIKKIQVNVSWSESGETKSISICTYLTHTE